MSNNKGERLVVKTNINEQEGGLTNRQLCANFFFVPRRIPSGGYIFD